MIGNDGPTDARPQACLLAAQGEWLGDCINQAPGNAADSLPVRQSPQQNHELVATETGDKIFCTQLMTKALGNHPQCLITRLVTQRVVDRFEAVEIKEKNRVQRTLFSEGVFQSFVEMGPVGQAGE